jgi:hypothetical protein
MALTGQLSDLSLAELIEFFCNQRKTGRLKVIYPETPGYFFIQAGALVDAKIGALRGVEAVYYALTLPNASFRFSAAFEATQRTIYQPWAQVVLEGLRRMDEGIQVDPGVSEDTEEDDPEQESESLEAMLGGGDNAAPAMFSEPQTESSYRKPIVFAAVAAAVLASVAAIGFPAGWYSRTKPPVQASSSSPAPVAPDSPKADPNGANAQPTTAAKDKDASTGSTSADASAAQKERDQRERDREKAREAKANAAETSRAAQTASTTPPPAAAQPKPKQVTVTVTYDEAGRVTAASGGDATAMRIARQKRFPAGKAGSTTLTIPIN